MEFTALSIPGAFRIGIAPIVDGRGFFARAFCEEEFTAHGLCARFVQANLSYTRQKGTIRGLHYQAAPYAEAKLIRCVRGAIWDVCVDLREASSAYGEWLGAELTAGGRDMLYLPAGCAHGYQALADDTEVLYSVSAPYVPAYERGVRWDDPAFAIEWKYPGEAILSDKDRCWEDFIL